MKNIPKFLALMTSCTLATQVWAQTHAEDLFSLPIEELMQLEVASATLTNETLTSVPSSVAIFNRQEIQQLGLTNLDEILNFVTGFQSVQSDRDPRFNKVSSRGRASGSGGGEILILLNGQRINSEYSGANDYTLPLIPLSIVEKIEVIKGPGSSIYGSNAFLGVINILTISKHTPQVSLAAGNMGGREYSASAGYQAGDFSVQAIAAYGRDKGDLYKQETDSFISTEQHDLYDAIQHKELIFNLKYAKTALHITSSEQQSEDYYIQGNIGKGFNFSKTESVFVTLNHLVDWSDTLQTDIWLDYRDNKTDLSIQGTSEFAFFEVTTPPTTAPLLAKTPIYETAKGIRVNNFYQLNSDLRLSVGLEHRSSKLEKDRSYTNIDYQSCLNSIECATYLASGGAIKPQQHPNIAHFDGEFRENILFVSATQRDINGAFAQAQIRLGDKTEMTLGARYDKYSDIGSNTSPRISVVHNFDMHHTFKINYGEAYRAPQLNELGLQNNPLVQGNPNLNAEIVKSFDLIWLGNFEKWTASATYFSHQIKDPILAGVQNNQVVLLNQQENQRTEGLEAELTYIPQSNMYFKLGATHILDKAEDQFKESDNLFFAIANYQYQKWNFNLSTNYQSEKQTVEYKSREGTLVELDDYWVTNAKVSYQINENTRVFAAAKNLFDTEYRTPAISNSADQGVPNRGLQWFVGAEVSF
ncbi:TonB-dependent receptor plug domain-containing protein [Catenovulum sediminis]|uniref:TonB-dependent receptor plug domain-containing protein n=1 Tax=Catenovulum sediminis TaxID=1740262 RepID=UPI00117C414A|nr:TonB-dependent receptor [Catenovulum sediminis]